MERLIKPIDYAQKLGISRQAIYAKIKRGIFKSKNIDGKLYIVMDDENHKTKFAQNEENLNHKEQNVTILNGKKSNPLEEFEMLLGAKDETIAILKDTVKDLKESNKQMSTTLRGEIDLLKEAFYEMRTLYVSQIGHMSQSKEYLAAPTIDANIVESGESHWVLLKDFFKIYQIDKAKKQEKLTKRLKKAHKKGDVRIMIKEGELNCDSRATYEDILR